MILLLESSFARFFSSLPKKWSLFQEGFFVEGGWKEVVEGLGYTFLISILGLLIGILIGTLIASVRVMPKYKRSARVLDKICAVYVAFFRGTPIVVQLLFGYFVILPMVGLGDVLPENACIVIFGLNSGAYVSEIMRGGLNSVDYGQMEAGRALGLSYPVTMFKFVVPQAVKNILPTLGNEFISLIKETSVISFVGATDFCIALTKFGENNYETIVPYIVMAVCYIIIIFIITQLIKLIEKAFAKSDRQREGKHGK